MYVCMYAIARQRWQAANLQGGEVSELLSDERVAEPLHLLLVALAVTLT